MRYRKEDNHLNNEYIEYMNEEEIELEWLENGEEGSVIDELVELL